MKTAHKALIALASVFSLGFLDWLTTVVGLISFRGTELNPVLSGLTKSNMLLFSLAKLSAVTLAGLTAYKAVDITKNIKNHPRLVSKLVNAGIALTVLALTVTVANNLIIVFQL